MTQDFALQGFMVKATVPAATGPEDHYFAVGADTEIEAEDAVFQHLDAPKQCTITAAKRLSPQEVAGLRLKPDEVRQYAP